MRDLEIRGAGNLLGPEQSGHMMSVGYDMYLQLLEEAVLEERGEKKASRTDCSADLTVSANLPESYIPSPEQRMDIYRRIAAVRTREESQDLLDEMLDRYGEPPASMLALLDVAMLRGEACAAGIRDISQRGDTITFTFGGEMPVEAVMRVCAMGKNKRRLTLSAGIEPKLALRLEGGEKPLHCGARAGREHRARRGRLNPQRHAPGRGAIPQNSEERGNEDETYFGCGAFAGAARLAGRLRRQGPL